MIVWDVYLCSVAFLVMLLFPPLPSFFASNHIVITLQSLCVYVVKA